MIRLVSSDVLVRESERMAHLVAHLRATQAGDGDQLRVVTAGHEVEEVGVVVEQDPARLVGMWDELHIGRQFPFAQAVKVGVRLSGA